MRLILRLSKKMPKSKKKRLRKRPMRLRSKLLKVIKRPPRRARRKHRKLLRMLKRIKRRPILPSKRSRQRNKKSPVYFSAAVGKHGAIPGCQGHKIGNTHSYSRCRSQHVCMYVCSTMKMCENTCV